MSVIDKFFGSLLFLWAIFSMFAIHYGPVAYFAFASIAGLAIAVFFFIYGSCN
jgi:hypothetical protein